MKKVNFTLALCILISSLSFSQRYRSAADTIKLNQEYNQLTSSLIDLNAKLNNAQNNMPGYKNRADKAVNRAEDAAQNNRTRASEASGDNIKDAKRAKREARIAMKDAKKAKSANRQEEGEDRKIENLKTEIQRKQDRLQQLETMRTDIRNKVSQ